MTPCSDVRYLEIGLSAAAFLNVIDHGGPLRLVPKGKFSLSEKKKSVEAAPSFSLTASLIVFGQSVVDLWKKKRKEKKEKKVVTMLMFRHGTIVRTFNRVINHWPLLPPS